MSGAADPQRAAMAMGAVRQYLIREADGLVLLLAPPFGGTDADPGYIKAYPPGVRENGGQYTHAAIWVLWALAELRDGDLAVRLFQRMLPIRHALTPDAAALYRVEPYVLAADVYGVPPHTGRGGWTWYTGAAGWAYRFGLEVILGIRPEPGGWRVDPCIPKTWPGFEVTLRDGTTTYRIQVGNPHSVNRGVESVVLDGKTLLDSVLPRLQDGRAHDVVARMRPAGDDCP